MYDFDTDPDSDFKKQPSAVIAILPLRCYSVHII